MEKKKAPSPNDQRSVVKNSTSKQFPQDKVNTAKQIREQKNSIPFAKRPRKK